MFRLSTLAISFLMGLNVLAFDYTVDIKQAKTVAENFAVNHFQQTNIPIFDHQLLSISSDEHLHLFNSSSGFVIVSSSKAIYPILGWSNTQLFQTENIPIFIKQWLKSYLETAHFIEKKQILPADEVTTAWEKLASGEKPSKSVNEQTGPLTLTTWNQGCYYNSMLPLDTLAPCSHVYTGCVATAMAQVMKYYNFPKSGIGNFGYNSNYGWIEADFSNTSYDWASMPINLTDENPAVAELMAHAAISVSSQFFYNGTGAFDFDARDALVNFFNYSSESSFLWRNSYQGDWIGLLQSELSEGRLVMYGGVEQSTQFGHTFVLDGFQDNFFHINWGWGGQYNGYYLIDTLTPAGFHFDYQHDAIIGIQPNIENPGQLYGPENLSANVDQHTVNITWDDPAGNNSLELIGYNIFRNDTLLNPTTLLQTEYLDTAVPAGSHTYKVTAIFIGSGSGKSESTEIYVSSISNQPENSLSIFPNPAQHELTILNNPKKPIQ